MVAIKESSFDRLDAVNSLATAFLSIGTSMFTTVVIIVLVTDSVIIFVVVYFRSSANTETNTHSMTIQDVVFPSHRI